MARYSARAIAINPQGQLLLIKRTKPNQPEYWTTPGGQVELTDLSLTAALTRELWEECGAIISHIFPVFQVAPSTGHETIQRFFRCRLVDMNPALRIGPEFTNNKNGAYQVELIDLTDDGLFNLPIKPNEIKGFLFSHRDSLRDFGRNAIPLT